MEIEDVYGAIIRAQCHRERGADANELLAELVSMAQREAKPETVGAVIAEVDAECGQ